MLYQSQPPLLYYPNTIVCFRPAYFCEVIQQVFFYLGRSTCTAHLQTRTETQTTFYKVMALSVLLYGSETWTIRPKDTKQNPSNRNEILKIS
jgi:hypothetical protein